MEEHIYKNLNLYLDTLSNEDRDVVISFLYSCDVTRGVKRRGIPGKRRSEVSRVIVETILANLSIETLIKMRNG